MKSNLVRFTLLFALLSVTPQVSRSMAITDSAQNANSSTTVETQISPKSARCRIKCRKAFGRCTRARGDVRRRCLIRYRDCLRRCAR
jgi:hypothetical protein